MPEAGGCAAEASARAGPPAVDPGARGVPPEPPKDGGDPGGEIVIPPALDDGDWGCGAFGAFGTLGGGGS